MCLPGHAYLTVCCGRFVILQHIPFFIQLWHWWQTNGNWSPPQSWQVASQSSKAAFSYVLWWAKGIHWATQTGRKSGIKLTQSTSSEKVAGQLMLVNAITKDEVKSLWIKSVWKIDFLLSWKLIDFYRTLLYLVFSHKESVSSLYKPSLWYMCQLKLSETKMIWS